MQEVVGAYLVPRPGRVHKPQIGPDPDPTFRVVVYRGRMDLMTKDISSQQRRT